VAGLRITVGLFGVAVIALAAYGFIRLATEMADNGDWIWFSALILFLVGSAAADVVRWRRGE
jgi:hypothetical protein